MAGIQSVQFDAAAAIAALASSDVTAINVRSRILLGQRSFEVVGAADGSLAELGGSLLGLWTDLTNE